MHCWNSIALFCLCSALDKVLPPANAARQTSPHAILWRCLMSVSRSPPAAECRECQRRQLPIVWLIHHSAELRRCRHCSVSVLHQVLYTSLSHLSSFLQSPVPCLPSPLHILLSSEMPPAEQFFLSPYFHLSFLNILFLYQVKKFLNFQYPPPQPSLPIISLCIPMVLSSASLVLTTNHCLLQLSPCFFCLFPQALNTALPAYA